MGRPRTTDPAPLRVLKIVEALFGAVLDGMSNSELTANTGYSPSNVSRDLDFLRQAGWAYRMENGRWALTTKPVALMQTYQLYMSDLAGRGEAFNARVAAQARQLF